MEKLFSLVSDPRILYLTNALKDCIKRVDYTIEKRQGLTCILGDIGLGKTSILRLIHWKYVDNADYMTAMIPTPNFTSDFAMLKQICNEFDVPPKRSLYEQQKALEDWLITRYEEGKNVVLFIDEAQKLKAKELELIRVFLNFESYEHKLIQVVLVGQLELRERLLEKNNKALYSRVFAPTLLAPLTLEETTKLIEHRCKIEEIDNPFTSEQIEQIYQKSTGVPREIIKQCLYILSNDQPAALEGVANERPSNSQKDVQSNPRKQKAKARTRTKSASK